VAPSLAVAKTRLIRVVSRWGKELPEAMSCLREGFPAATTVDGIDKKPPYPLPNTRVTRVAGEGLEPSTPAL
jgi:hypothetical protein